MTNEKYSVTTLVALMGIGLVLAGWIYFLNTSNTSLPLSDETISPPPQTVTVRHQYSDSEGEHRYSGSVNVPTPCHSLVSQAIVRLELEPDEVMLNLTTSTDTEECEQKVTLKIFLIAFKADARALVAATLNGKNILLDTIEVEKNESVVLIP